MTVVVRMDAEHYSALLRARLTLLAEEELLQRWGQHSVELTLAIENVDELLDRYARQIEQHPDPWSRKVTT